MTFYDLIAATTFLERYHINYMDLPTDNHLPIVVDVDGDAILRGENLTNADIPVKFRKVEGNFECQNNQLTSLDFAPEEVGGIFNCSYNNISDFDNIPTKHVEGNFYAYGSDPEKLTKLKSIVKGKIFPKH